MAIASTAKTVRGLSDRAIAWLFIAPTIFLLLAINIFPLLWTIYLSFTNYRANRPNEPIEFVGLRNYARILNSEDVWGYLQVTAHFLFWTISLELLIGFALALLINHKFRGHAFWTTVILLPMMLSPAVVGLFWSYIFQPQAGIFNYIVNFFSNVGDFTMIGDKRLAPWAIIILT
jgi:multiple sugar transport system permease protein